MSYDKNSGHMKHFVPNIIAGTTSAPACAIDLAVASGTHGEYLCVKACRVRQIGFAVNRTAVVGTTTAPTVILSKRVTPLSASGAVAVGTLTIPDGTAVGKMLYKEVTPVAFAVGDSMNIAWTLSGSASPAGGGQAFWICEDMEETPANNSDMVASA